MKAFAAAAVAAALFALPLAAAAEVHYYLVETMAEKSTNPATRAEAHELEKIYTDMAQQAGVDAKLVYSTNSRPRSATRRSSSCRKAC